MKNIAIIPARGGSKRLENKNIKPLFGIPLIEHTIRTALSCDKIDATYVSTDCEKIKAQSILMGAQVIDRPQYLSDDKSTTASAIKHATEVLDLSDKDNIVLLQPTNPIRPNNLIENCLKIFQEKKLESLFSVSENHHKLGEIIGSHFYPYNYKFGQRSQDMKKLYFENGLIYITKVSLISKEIIFNSDSYPYLIESRFPIVDIDYLEDFQYAEFLLKSQNYAH